MMTAGEWMPIVTDQPAGANCSMIRRDAPWGRLAKVEEIRIRGDARIYRAIYTERFVDAIFVRHAFWKTMHSAGGPSHPISPRFEIGVRIAQDDGTPAGAGKPKEVRDY
jgi:hypothetical protein